VGSWRSVGGPARLIRCIGSQFPQLGKDLLAVERLAAGFAFCEKSVPFSWSEIINRVIRLA